MLRGPIRVLLGLVDRAARAWVRWRAGRCTRRIRGRWTDADLAAARGLGGAGASRRPRPARALRRRSHARSHQAPRILVRKRWASSPTRHGSFPPAIAKPASPSAAPKPCATPRPSQLEVPASAPTSGQEAAPPAIPVSRPRPAARGWGRPRPTISSLGAQHTSATATVRARSRDSARTLGDAGAAVRAPASTEPPAADSTPVDFTEEDRTAQSRTPPFRRRSPRRSRPKPRRGRSIGRILQPINPPAARKARRPSERLAEDRSDSDSHRWPDLPDPPEEGGPDVEAALRKMERDRQVAREHSRL